MYDAANNFSSSERENNYLAGIVKKFENHFVSKTNTTYERYMRIY